MKTYFKPNLKGDFIMEITTWTIKNRDGEMIEENVLDIQTWIKNHNNVIVVYWFNSIKELIIY